MPHTLFLALLEQAPQSTSLGGTQGPDLTRYLLVCGGLLVAVALLGFTFRRVVGRKLKSRAAQRSLQVVDVLPLGGKQKLAVVRCYDRTFLIGVGEKEVSKISELDAVIAAEHETPPTRADVISFSQVLARLKRPRGAAAASVAKEGILA